MDLNTAPDSPTQENTTVDSAASALDDGIPQWIKESGLEAAHSAAKPGTVVTNLPAAQPKPAQQAAPAQVAGQVSAQPPAAQPPVASVPPGMDPKAFIEAVRAAVPPPASQAQQSQGASDEELARQLGIVTVTPEIYKGILGVDGTPEQVSALNNLMQMGAKQAVSVSSVIFQQALQSLRAELTPYTGAVRQQQADQHKTTFFTKHPDLNQYQKLVEQQYTILKASGQQFPDAEAAYAALAQSTRDMLQSLGIKPTAAAAVHGNQPNRPNVAPVQTQRQMAPTSMGGRSGASPAGKPTTHQAVWA